ncbi:MAG TPA: class I SAM-dependent RNA methyltransferase, partial [Balneolaceae bacterium]|nr:class I SAM-dependent RNA methyltransferase [Balneolaceae bacterium]
MADFSQKRTVRVTCPFGMATHLESEIRDLGFTPLNVSDTGIEVSASLNDTITLNYWLRTAHRIHALIAETDHKNPDELKEWLREIPWEEWIDEDGYFSVTSRVDHPDIENSQFANLITKDAIVDRMRSSNDQRPDTGSDLDKTVLFLYWNDDVARIFVDTSGESLSRRNYRTDNVAAPMQETLAAGIVRSTKWEPGRHFINPMTGGGTIAIEAALMATNRAPASLRNNFGFMHIRGFDEDAYYEVRKSAKESVNKEPEGRIIASDNDPRALEAAKRNAKTAGVDHLITFETCDYSDTTIPDGKGVVVMNPPYGIRLEPGEDLRPLYKGMGDFLKNE